MEKMDMTSMDMTELNIEKIAQMFPEAITEEVDNDGHLVRQVKFDVLQQLLGAENDNQMKERYDFTWPGKREAMKSAAEHTTKVLRPCPQESKNWDTTQNLYIEGDNLDVLKILQESYLGKVKLIYIDPPYNTGNDFLYNDSFSQSKEEFGLSSGVIDDAGDHMYQNTDSNPRFHSLWCSKIFSPLSLARNLLATDGVIFINIDDHEQANLKKICDEIFGSQNYIATCPRITKRTSNKGTFFKPTKDYVYVYAKDLSLVNSFGVDNHVDIDDFKEEDEYGRYKQNGASLYQPSLDSRPNQRYYIECPDGSFIIPPGEVFPSELKDGAFVKPKSNKDKIWRWTYDSYLAKKSQLIFTKASDRCPLIDNNGQPSKWNIYDKVYYKDKEDSTLLPEDIFISDYISDYPNSQGTKELIQLGIPFPFAKPTGLIKYIIKLCLFPKDIIVLDFFSGSATTAHAVMQLNAEDGGTRTFVMVQLPEPCDEKSEAFKAGYKTICDIGKERIRRAGEAIKKQVEEDNAKLGMFEEGKKQVPDIGFRDFKLDSSNMKDIYFGANEVSQLELTDTNIKDDRADLDLLFGVMEDWGLELSLPYEKRDIGGVAVHIVDKGALIACFAKDVPESVIIEMAKMSPERVVFRDDCFKDSVARINVEQLFKHYDPIYKNGVLKVI